MRTRAVVASLGLGLVALGIGVRPAPSDAAAPGHTGSVTIVALGDAGAAEMAAEMAVDTVTATAVSADSFGEVLAGLDGAATAVAARDTTRALALTAAMSPPEGSADWFTAGAIAGRAHRIAGDPRQAIAALRPRVEHRASARSFPPDVLGVELAEAQLEFARSKGVAPAEADAQLRDGIGRLGKLAKLEPLRNFAQIEVLRAQMLAELSDSAGARKAVTALHEVLQSYPHHPERGRMWLEHALALERSGRVADALAELRNIVVERNGEPEGEAAWDEFERISAAHGKRVTPLSAAERLASATAARRNKRVDLSRDLLEQLIADPATPASIREQAQRSRSVTAAKQRDFATCAADQRKAYARSPNIDTRDDLLKCLEKGGFYDEAIDVWLAEVKQAKRKQGKAHATWEAIDLAVRGGKYERALELLARYEKIGKAHGQERAWLHAWLLYRTGAEAAAIPWFLAYETKYRSDARRARYFRAKLMLRSADPATEEAGAVLLRGVASADPLGYYGLLARQRLLDDSREVPAVPKLAPVAEELDPPRRADAQKVLAELDADFGAAWPPIARARRLYTAGYNDEARRELRVAVQAFLTRGKKPRGPRNEDVVVGLGWKANWKFPRVAPTKAARKQLRDRDAVEALRVGLREVAFALQEPHAYVKLSTSREAPVRARWTIRAFRPAVEREARLRKIDPKHMWALMYTESRFRPHVVSPVGARGALQIMPWTAHQLAERLGETDSGNFYDTDRLFDIDTNAHLSAYYVAELLNKFHGQAPMAYASYNGGPSNVARWLTAKSQGKVPLELDAFVEEIALGESYRYTKRVSEVYATYSLIYDGELPRWSNTVDPVYEDNIDF